MRFTHSVFVEVMLSFFVKICYIVLYDKYERTKMVQLIQNFLDSLRISTISYGDSFDNVDPNLVRYFRTEYGRDWKTSLNEYLFKQNRKLSNKI